MPANPALRAGLALCTPAVGLVGCHCVAACAGLCPLAPIARNLSSRSSFALYSTYSLIHRHCRQPRIVRRVVRHDPRPVHPGGPVNDGSFRRAIGADKTVAATPACFLGRAARAKQKTKRNIRPQAAKTLSICCCFSRPIRSSPMVTKANSIVWMTPNERAGAWMPLGVARRII